MAVCAEDLKSLNLQDYIDKLEGMVNKQAETIVLLEQRLGSSVQLVDLQDTLSCKVGPRELSSVAASLHKEVADLIGRQLSKEVLESALAKRVSKEALKASPSAFSHSFSLRGVTCRVLARRLCVLKYMSCVSTSLTIRTW